MRIKFPLLLLLYFISVTAHAALVGRLPATPGGTDYQAAYDTVLDITWVTHADLSGDGTWDNQVAWAGNLDYLGYRDWRLASLSVDAGLPTGTAQYDTVINCSTASELDCRDNELGYMFYHNMGGSFRDDKRGDQTVDGVLLTNVQSDYWTGTEYAFDDAWRFQFLNGGQDTSGKDYVFNHYYAWAVRSGDVSAVPVPAAIWLFGSGLIGLIGVARRKKA